MTPGRVATGWAERYEALRAYATGQAPLDGIPPGLALLQHHGMVAWMTAAGSDDAAGRAVSRPCAPTGDAGDGGRRALVRLLADVAFPLTLRSAL